jgi:N-methylhydantoinase A
MPSERETVTFRLRAFGEMPKLEVREIEQGGEDASSALKETRSVHLARARQDCGVYDRTMLKAGNIIAGPAIVEEPAHVTVIFPGDMLRVDSFGNLIVTIGG